MSRRKYSKLLPGPGPAASGLDLPRGARVTERCGSSPISFLLPEISAEIFDKPSAKLPPNLGIVH